MDLPSDVALEAAGDLAFGSSLGGAPLDIGASGRVHPHAGEHDRVDRPIQLPVATSV